MMNTNNNSDTLPVENVIARQIVAEIMKFGVTQKQLTKIIELLALELENRDMMINLCNVLNNNIKSDMSSTHETSTKNFKNKLII